MDLVYIRTNEDGTNDSGYLTNYSAVFAVSIDTDYVTNNFEVTVPLPKERKDLLWAENAISSILFVEGTEYGGLIEGSVIDIEQNTLTYTGRTWRGNLDQWIVEPPAGQDYLVVSGNLATTLRLLPMGNYIVVDDTVYSGTSFTFDRYCTTFEGATKLLRAAQANLRMAIEFSSTGLTGEAHLSIVETRDLRSLVELSQDYNDQINLKITRDGNTPKHLICLGQGELKDRQVIHLYADDDWNISQTPIAGAYPVGVYDFSSSTDLLSDGMKYYKEQVHNHEQIEVTINDLDIKLSDIIAAKDILTGEEVSAEITSITWRCENNGDYQTESYEYLTQVLL